MTRRFDYIDHTADIIIKAYGDTLAEAFAAAAEGMFAVITDEAEIQPNQRETIEIESIDREGLLVNFLSELIVLHEAQNVVIGQIAVELLSDTRLRADLGIEPFDDDRHAGGSQVKGVSYHMLEIEDAAGDQPAGIQVLLDI